MTHSDYAAHHVAIIRGYQHAFHNLVLIPLMKATIDHAWETGALPLPPFGWCRREWWYLGDLS